MAYRISSFGLIVFRDGSAVWDDVLHHRQTLLTANMMEVISQYTSQGGGGGVNRDLLESEAHARLVEQEILIEDAAPRAEQERSILEGGWRSWITLARLFHFSTRITMSDSVLATDQSTQLAVERRVESAPPDRFSGTSNGEIVDLPQSYEFDGADTPFLDVLEGRRTCRRFRNEPISLATLASVLSASARISRKRPESDDDRKYGNIFRNSPSGGARSSTEVYVQARNVDGLPPGNYRYLPRPHALQSVGSISNDEEMLTAVSGQSWFLETAAIFALVGNIERYSWKYTDKRSYPSMLVDAGHLSQNLCLAATALGLGVAITGVQRDEAIEREFGIDPAREIVILASAIGVAESEDVMANSFPPGIDPARGGSVA